MISSEVWVLSLEQLSVESLASKFILGFLGSTLGPLSELNGYLSVRVGRVTPPRYFRGVLLHFGGVVQLLGAHDIVFIGLRLISYLVSGGLH